MRMKEGYRIILVVKSVMVSANALWALNTILGNMGLGFQVVTTKSDQGISLGYAGRGSRVVIPLLVVLDRSNGVVGQMQGPFDASKVKAFMEKFSISASPSRAITVAQARPNSLRI